MFSKAIVTAFATACMMLGMTSVASAGCDPKCKEGEQCRYEATNGGTFYCEALNNSASADSAGGDSTKGGVDVNVPSNSGSTGEASTGKKGLIKVKAPDKVIKAGLKSPKKVKLLKKKGKKGKKGKKTGKTKGK